MRSLASLRVAVRRGGGGGEREGGYNYRIFRIFIYRTHWIFGNSSPPFY